MGPEIQLQTPAQIQAFWEIQGSHFRTNPQRYLDVQFKDITPREIMD